MSKTDNHLSTQRKPYKSPNFVNYGSLLSRTSGGTPKVNGDKGNKKP